MPSKNDQTITNSFENILMTSNENKIIETDRGNEFHNSNFQNFLYNDNIQHYSRKGSLAAVFAERFNLRNRNLSKRPVFETSDGNWIDVICTITKQNNNRFHSSTKLTPIQASLDESEGFVNKNSLEKREKIKPKYKIGDLVRTADLKKTFSKSDTTNWSNKLYELTEIFDETIPGYKRDVLKKRYIESLLKKHC